MTALLINIRLSHLRVRSQSNVCKKRTDHISDPVRKKKSHQCCQRLFDKNLRFCSLVKPFFHITFPFASISAALRLQEKSSIIETKTPQTCGCSCVNFRLHKLSQHIGDEFSDNIAHFVEQIVGRQHKHANQQTIQHQHHFSLSAGQIGQKGVPNRQHIFCLKRC